MCLWPLSALSKKKIRCLCYVLFINLWQYDKLILINPHKEIMSHVSLQMTTIYLKERNKAKNKREIIVAQKIWFHEPLLVTTPFFDYQN